MEGTNFVLVIVLVALGCAVTLFFLERKRGALEDRTSPSPPEAGNAEVSAVVSHEISKLNLPSSKAGEVSQFVSNLVDKEAHKKAAFVSEAIGKQYAKMMDERDKKLKYVEEKFEMASQRLETVSKNYKKVSIEKKQTEAVVRSIAEGLIVVNEKGETLMMNPAAERLLGVKRQDVMGKSILNQAKEEQLISMAAPGESGEEREIMLNSQNAETRKVLRQSTAVIENEVGQTMGMVSVLTDVTKQKELEEMKNKFVSNVTHELRTPLAAIKESVNLMLDKMLGEVNSEQEKVLTIAKRNIQRLGRLIDDVLDISRLESGKLELRVTKFQVEDLIKHNTASFESWAKTKTITLETKLPEEKLEMEADSDQLTQVLTNLIGNAMKFTPNGGKISIEAKQVSLAEGDPAPAIEISVVDTGPGISEKDQKKIFEKFSQGSVKTVDKISGTGLGLAICKEICTAHGGRIWVSSQEGLGSRFVFVIPKNVQAANAAPVK